jgi:hypothetical protein
MHPNAANNKILERLADQTARLDRLEAKMDKLLWLLELPEAIRERVDSKKGGATSPGKGRSGKPKVATEVVPNDAALEIPAEVEVAPSIGFFDRGDPGPSPSPSPEGDPSQ